MMKHFKISRYSLLMMILFLAPVSSSAIGVAEDLVRAGMFKTFATSATKVLKASDRSDVCSSDLRMQENT